MAFDIALPKVEGNDILDALGKYAALHQARVASQFAQPNAQANLDKLKALIQQTNLANQTSELKMPYVAPKEQSTIDQLRAHANYLNAESHWMPTKYGQAAKRLEIDSNRYSPTRLDILDKYRQALTGAIPTKNLTAFGKAALEQSNVEKGLLPTGQPGQLGAELAQNAPQAVPGQAGVQSAQNTPQAAPGSPAAIQNGSPLLPNPPVLTEEAKQLINQYKLKRVKDTTTAKVMNAFPQIESIDNTFKSIPFETVAKFYGPMGQLKAAKAYEQSIHGYLDPEYEQYQNFLTTSGPALVAQQRQFLNDSVTPGAQEHVRSIVFPKKWTSNPTLALNQFHALQKVYNIEKASRVRAANDASLYQGKESAQPSAAPVNVPVESKPKSNSVKDLREWMASVPADVAKAYIAKLK